MNMTRFAMKFVTACATLALAVQIGSSAASAGASQRLALQFLGSAEALPWDALSEEAVAEIEALDASGGDFSIDDLQGFACFELDLNDVSTGLQVGTAVDCLAPTPVGPAGDIFDAIDVRAVSVFILPGGSFVSEGDTSVRAFIPGVGDGGALGDGEGFTHITGSFPTVDNITAGTRRFRTVNGTTRVSGVVDLSQFVSDGIIFFNCLWIIDLERGNKPK